MTGAQLQAKVSKVLAKVNATARPVWLRSTTVAGGNAVLGIGQASTTVDTFMSPQPVVTLFKADDVAGSGGLIQFGDYRVIVAGSYTEAQLLATELLYGSDVLKVLSATPYPFAGVIAAWELVARAVKSS